MFVFTMQSMWKYIDDIIGKGASIGLIIEFVFYLSLGLLPLALPAAVLLASLFMMGNFAERYELTSMKSAGLSFMRVIRPLVAVTALVALFSFICSNFIVPVANLKFQTRLYDFKNQKLAFSLGEGIFNDDFQNFAIRVGENNEKTGEMKDIMMYDHSGQNYKRTRIILAEKATTDTKSDDRYMIMKLYKGQQYQEMEEKKGTSVKKGRRYPYLRIHFDELEKYLDTKEFEMTYIDENLFKGKGKMMSIRQLYYERDTMLQKVNERNESITKLSQNSFYFVKKSDSTRFYLPMADVVTISKKEESNRKIPSVHTSKKKLEMPKKEKPFMGGKVKASKMPKLPQKNKTSVTQIKHNQELLQGKPKHFVDIFEKKHRETVMARGESTIKSISGRIYSNKNKVERLYKRIFGFSYQMHLKFSLALVCFVFLFIGAPLGAIIRKGGFGYPVLVGVLCFVLFVTLVTVFEKLGDNGTLPSPLLSAWIPVIIFFIPCFLLTRSAMRDAQPISAAAIQTFFKKFKWKKKH